MLDGSAYGLVLQPPPEDPEAAPEHGPKTVATAYSHLVRSARFAPRAVFSPSQIEKADADVVYKNFRGEDESNGCLQAWGYRYLEGLKEPEIEWSELPPDATPSQMARPFGKALHTQNENYYKGIPFDLSNEAGKRAHAGSHLLPHPTECAAVYTEQRLKIRTTPSAAAGYGSGISEPIAWNGSKDLTVDIKPGARFTPGLWLLDYKSTKDFNAYQKDAAKLAKDGQAQLYGLDVMVDYRLPRIPARWVYYASPACKGPARALPTDFVIDWAPALEVVQRMTDKAAELRAYITLYRDKKIQVSDLPPQPLACKSFGGCPYGAGHKVRGPKDARGKDTWVPMPGPCKNDVRYESEAHGGIILIGRLTHMTATTPTVGLSIAEKVAQATAAAQGAAPAPGGPPPGWVGTGAPGYAASAGAHLGQPLPNGGHPLGAAPPAASGPVATPPIGAPLPAFQAPAGPAPAPTMFTPVPGLTPNTPAPAPSLPQAAPQTPPAPVAPPPAPARPQPPQDFGKQGQNPDYWWDGNGGWLDRQNLVAACGYYGLDPNQFPNFAPPPVSHVNPPEASQAGAPAPFQPPQVAAPGGAPPVAQVPTTVAPATAGKRKRRTKQQIAEDNAAIARGEAPPHGGGKSAPGAPAESEDDEPEAGAASDAVADTTWAVKLKLTGPGGAILEVPCPPSMADQIGGYVAEQVKRLLG